MALGALLLPLLLLTPFSPSRPPYDCTRPSSLTRRVDSSVYEQTGGLGVRCGPPWEEVTPSREPTSGSAR